MDVYRIAKPKRRARGRSSLAHWPASRTQESRSLRKAGTTTPPAPPSTWPGHLASPAAHPMPPRSCISQAAAYGRYRWPVADPTAHPWASCCRLIPGWLLRDACCARAGARCTARRRNRIGSVMRRLVHTSYVKYAGVRGYTATPQNRCNNNSQIQTKRYNVLQCWHSDFSCPKAIEFGEDAG